MKNNMTAAAHEFALETGSDFDADVAKLLAAGHDDAWFLDECTDGADEDRLDGSNEYYHAVSAAAQDVRELSASGELRRVEISSRDDLLTYIDNHHPDFQGDDRRELAATLMSLSPPDYGRDWSEWLHVRLPYALSQFATA